MVGQRMSGTEWSLLFFLAFLWGGSFFTAKVAGAEIPPLTLVLLRVGIAAAALLIACRASGISLAVSRQVAVALAVMGLLNNVVPFGLIFWAQLTIDSGLTSILNATTPISALVLAHLLLPDEKLTAPRMLGVVVGFAGAVVMIGPDLLEGLGRNALSQLACVLATVSYACAGIWGRRFRALPPLLTATGQLTASTAILLPLVLLVDRPWDLAQPSMPALGAVLALALICTSFPYVIYFRLLATAGAGNLLLVTMLVPAGAILLGSVFLDETLLARQWLGLGLIVLGLLVIDGRLAGALRRPA